MSMSISIYVSKFMSSSVSVPLFILMFMFMCDFTVLISADNFQEMDMDVVVEMDTDAVSENDMNVDRNIDKDMDKDKFLRWNQISNVTCPLLSLLQLQTILHIRGFVAQCIETELIK
jgi:hypothetical protein